MVCTSDNLAQAVSGSRPAPSVPRWFSVQTLDHVFKISYRAFSHDVTAAMWCSENNETAAMLVYQDNPVGVELFCHANAFFFSNKFAYMLAR